MSEAAKAKAAAPAKKAPQPGAKAKPGSSSLLRTREWEPAVEDRPRGTSAAGRPLGPATRAAMETRFGHDFGRVRIHIGPEAAAAVHNLGALAFTLGLDVHFGEGRYQPDRPAGRDLLIHELEHVVRAGPRGPDVPRLKPAPGVNHRQRLSDILKTPRNREADFAKYMAANPQVVVLAEELLVQLDPPAGKAEIAQRARLYRTLFKMDPQSESRVAALLRNRTEPLRRDAVLKTGDMWKNYESAAYAQAWVQWADKRLAEEKKKHPPVPRGGPPPEPTAVERLLEKLRKKAQSDLDDLVKKRTTSLRGANAALKAMVEAATPVPYVQEDILDQVSDRINGALGEARRERLHSYEDNLTLEKNASAELLFTRSEADLEQASKAEQEAQANRQALESPAVPAAAPAGGAGSAASSAPETPAQKKARERALAVKLKEAKKTEATASAQRQKAEATMHLRAQDVVAKTKAEHRLRDALPRRNSKIQATTPDNVQEPGVALADLLDEGQRWWIYQTALNNLGTGFAGLSYESTVSGVLDLRSVLAEDKRALGVDYDVGVSTYDRHGEGQYDIYSEAGKDVKAALPDQVDLTLVLGKLPGSTGPRLFQRVSSAVASAAALDEHSGDEAVLAKLLYGFFGFEQKDRKKMKEYLAATDRTKLPKPNPDATRILGGLTFDETIANNSPLQQVDDDRKAVRAALENVLRTELKALTPPVDIPSNVDVLARVDAKQGNFSGLDSISVQTYNAFSAAQGTSYSKRSAAEAVYRIVRKAVLDEPTVSEPMEKLLSGLLDNSQGDRSGPWVTLVHKYREAATRKEAWVEVDYRHLHDVERLKPGDPVAPGTLLGKVGSSGNSVSPHVHMAIRVYEREPRYGVQPIGYLVPLDFFPFRRR